jgi:hypothetical protein
MTAATAMDTRPAPPGSVPTLRALALADAVRFAKHPLFLFGVALIVLYAGLYPSDTNSRNDPSTFTIATAFAIGVFGFVVAHRLTTSLRRTQDLADTAPVSAQTRTASLCLSCFVPAATATALTIYQLFAAHWWPAVDVREGGQTAWFHDEPDLAIVAMLVALGPVAALGGPLLGVAVARWAPFRGSALIGMVVLIVGCTAAIEAAPPWRVLPPWASLVDESAEDGTVNYSQLTDGVKPEWYLGYVLCLCGLAVVAALLRDPPNRRRLVAAGAALTVGAAVCLLLTVV